MKTEIKEIFVEVKRIFRSFNSVSISCEDINRSVERGCQRGIYQSEYQTLAVAFGAKRLDLRLTVNELSEITKVPVDDIIDLELASFHLSQAVLISEKLKDALGFSDNEYNWVLTSSTRKL